MTYQQYCNYLKRTQGGKQMIIVPESHVVRDIVMAVIVAVVAFGGLFLL